MSQWAHNHPEEMAEIARLPLREQSAALRDAIGYDPDRIRDEHEERQRDCTCWHHKGKREGWTSGWPCPVHPEDEL